MWGESGELVCTKPIPCQPTHFWNDENGSKYRKAYFSKFPGTCPGCSLGPRPAFDSAPGCVPSACAGASRPFTAPPASGVAGTSAQNLVTCLKPSGDTGIWVCPRGPWAPVAAAGSWPAPLGACGRVRSLTEGCASFQREDVFRRILARDSAVLQHAPSPGPPGTARRAGLRPAHPSPSLTPLRVLLRVAPRPERGGVRSELCRLPPVPGFVARPTCCVEEPQPGRPWAPERFSPGTRFGLWRVIRVALATVDSREGPGPPVAPCACTACGGPPSWHRPVTQESRGRAPVGLRRLGPTSDPASARRSTQ